MTTKTLKELFEVYKPKAPDEQKFVDKHVTIKHKDRNGNGDDVFNAKNIKTIERKKEAHGYNSGEDEKVYEENELDEDVGAQIADLMRKKNAATSPIARKNIESQIAKLKRQKTKSMTAYNEEVEELDEISAATKDSYAQKAGKQLPGLFKKSGQDADSARKYYNRKNTVRKIANEEVETLEEGMMKLSKVHIVHHHDHPAAKEFAKNYTAGMKGDHREGGPTEADEKASNAFHERYTGVRTREGFAGSGTHIYHDHKTGAKWKVDRHPNGKTFYGTDHIISHHTGGINESVEEGEFLDTVAEDRLLRSLVAYFEDISEEVNMDEIKDLAEELINELSTSTLQSYRKKARAQGNAIVDKMKMGGGDWSKDQKDTKTLRKRSSGAQMSGKTLRKRGESLKTEEVESIDELSVNKLDQYRTKARQDLIDADANDDTGTYNKRAKGYREASKKVQKKLTKEDVINNVIEKYVPTVEIEEIPLEEQLVARIDDLSEAHIHTVLDLFNSVNEENQINMIKLIDAGKINDVLDFAIEATRNRGE